MGNLAKCLPVTLKFEGGWSNNPHDPGGETEHGVTLRTLQHFYPGATSADLHNITDAQLLEIYDVGYWTPINGDSLASGVDLVAFDYSVNSGPGAANKALKASVGLSAVNRVKSICTQRLSMLHGLSTWKYFGVGWNSRVAQVESLGIQMAVANPVLAQVELTKAADEHKAIATTTVKKVTSSIVAASTVAAGSVATIQPEHIPVWVFILAGSAVVAAVGLVLFEMRKHYNAAAVLKAAATEV